MPEIETRSMSEIETSIENSGPDAVGTRTCTATASRLPFVATVQVQQFANGTVEISACGGVFWRVLPIVYRVSPNQPALTWESTDDELIAAAVKILEKAEGGQ